MTSAALPGYVPGPVGVVVKGIAIIGAGGFGFDFWAGEIGTVSPTARHRCDVSVCPRR